MKLKLYEANKWWNHWKFQLYWHNLEGVIQEVKSKGKNPIHFLQLFYLNKNDRTYHWVVHSDLK